MAIARAYEPFGSQMLIAGAAASPYGFAGEWRDATELIYLRARYYEPASARFLIEDPWHGSSFLPSTLNSFVYGLNNPTLLSDPSGHFPWVIAIGFGIAAVIWFAHPEPAYAPGLDWVPPPLPDEACNGDLIFLDTAPGTGDISDLYAVFTGRRLFIGDPQARLPAILFTIAPIATGGLKYLRNFDNSAFQRLLQLGARDGDEVFEILQDAGSSTVIRGVIDKGGNQLIIRAGNRNRGLRHIIGRHLTGSI